MIDAARPAAPRGAATIAGAIVMAILDAERDEDFPRAVCRAVHEHLSAHRVSLGMLHRRSGRFRAAYWPPMAPEAEQQLLATFGADLARHPQLSDAPLDPARDVGVTSWQDLDPDHEFFTTRLYREHYREQGVTDQVTVTLTGPAEAAIGMTVDRTGGDFTEDEKDVLRVVQHTLDAIFGHLAGSQPRDVLCSLGWTRIVVDPDGEVVECLAPEGRPILSPGDSLTGMPWWDDVRAAIAEDPVLQGSTVPKVRNITAGNTTVVVEQRMFADPVVYHFEGAPKSVVERAANRLTHRQAEVARLLVDGRSAREIAAHLHISLATARTHIEHVYRRLEVRNRAQAVALLLSSGVLD